MELGSWAAGSSVGSRWDGLRVLLYPQVVETWSISERNLVFWVSPPIPQSGSSVESPLSRTHSLPFLHFSANTFFWALLIVNLVWEQKTFTHRTSSIPRAEKSCWAHNWFLQPSVPGQVLLTSFSSKTAGQTRVSLACDHATGYARNKKRDFLTCSAAIVPWNNSSSWNAWF